MMRSNQVCRTLTFAPALIAVACGGSIDLESPRTADPRAKGGSTANASAGSGQYVPAGNAGGQGQGAGGEGEPAAPSGATAGMGGAPAVPSEPKTAFLAFDAEPEGESRGIYWLSAPYSACRERISPTGVSAKQPAFSRDGELIAYAAEDDEGVYQIFTWETSRRITRQVTRLPQGATYPAFMPEAGRLAFVSGDPEGVRDGLVDDAPEMGDLMLLDLSSLQVQLLLARDASLDHSFFAPAFRTQTSLLVSNSYDIRELSLAFSGQEVSVVESRKLTSPGVPQEPSPSPDGSLLAYPDTCDDTLKLYVLSVAQGSPRSCTPSSRDYLPEAGVRSPDWGSFGFIAVELNAPEAQSLLLLDERDLSLTMHVAAPNRPRNPSWGPADFTRRCD